MNEGKTNINWYPGHMAKTKRLIKENINLIDIVYEVIDARIPLSSKIKDIDSIIKNKPRIIIMTKYDMCDKEETHKFIDYYKKQGYIVITLDLLVDKVEVIIKETKNMLKAFDESRSEKGLKSRRYRALIIGIPNAGKSTLVNRLVNKKATKVGNMPGITKNLSWIRISDDVEILDTPGILWPKLDNDEVAYNLAAVSSIKEDTLRLDKVAIHILNKLYNYYPDKLYERYGVNNIDDIIKALDIIGTKRGCLLKKGEIDYEKVYNVVIRDVKEGLIKNITFDRMGAK